MKKIIISLIYLLGVTNLLYPQSSQPSDFVRVSGTHFTVKGQPYYFLGTNMWYGCYLGADTSGPGRARLLRELDRLQALGITNIRVLAASEGLGEYQPVRQTIQPTPGEMNEVLLVGLDFLLAEMGKRGIYAVLFLNNYWFWSGGMAQYLAWLEPSLAPRPFQDNKQFDFMALSGQFYSHEQANALYRRFLHRLIMRRNTITGRRYRDDPTIMSWQLANEPRPHPRIDREQAFTELAEWADATAAFIHALDANHLVSTGNEGIAGCLESRECFVRLHRCPFIDYVTIHLWPGAWSWYAPKNPDATFPVTLKNARAYIQQHVDDAAVLGKPITLEEFGLARNDAGFGPTAPTTWRDRFYRTILQLVYDSASASSPLAGSNFWDWGGEGRPRDPVTGKWQEGDDWLDPTPEIQGGNAVYDCDFSTLKIFTEFAAKMTALR